MSVIAIDATYVVDPEPSGVSVYSRRLVESLADLDSPHRFLVCYRVSRWRQRGRFLRFREARSRRFSTRFFQEPWTFWLAKEAELFHSLAQRPAPFRFKKEIVTVHDIFPLTGRDYSTPEFQRKFSTLLVDAVRRAVRIILPSQYSAEQLLKYAGVAAEKIRVIPEGVDMPAVFLPHEAKLREREKLVGAGKEIILVVGVVQSRKNTLGALRVLGRLPERYRMVVAGGNGYGSQVVHDFLRSSGLASRVMMMGHVNSAYLSTLYQASSVLLFPSFEEGFGLPMLEAMAYGLPVLASKAASLPEVGGDAALYADPNDEAEFAACILRITEDNNLRDQMVEAGRTRASEFSWQRTAEQTLGVYEEALKL